MPKQAQTANAQADKENKTKPEPVVNPTSANDLGGLSQLPNSLMAAAGSGSSEAQAARLADPRWQSAQRQALAGQIGRIQGNRHLQRTMASLKQQNQAIQREGEAAPGHKMAMAIPITWTGGEKEFNMPVGSLIARKVYWSFEGSAALGGQIDKPGDAGAAVGPAGGSSKSGGPYAGFKVEDAQRLCSDEFTIGGVPAMTALDTKESFQLTSEAIDISVALEGSASVTFKSLKLQAGTSFTGQLTLLKKEFAKMKDGDNAASKPAKFVNASFALAVPVVGWQPMEGVTLQGKLSGVYEVEPNWSEILRRITERLGQAATSAAIETAIATGFILGGFLTIAAAGANIQEGHWVGEYCRQKSEAMATYLQDYDDYMRGAGSGGSRGYVDAAQHMKKVYEAGQAEGISLREINESLKSRPKGFYAAQIWNQTKAQVFAKAEEDYWAEHSITHQFHEWGFGSDVEDRDFQRFKQAFNAHIDGKMFPLLGIKASWF